jgi:2-polyprenyl-3-methyl-5-hydroxy-6-metoxy-1,4-benzoquinol methylase
MGVSADRKKDMDVGRRELEKIFRIKYGDASTTGWGPRLRRSFGYFTPDDFYEVVVAELVVKGCFWIDVGCGRDIFPNNRVLAHMLSERCGLLVGVDPSDNVNENPYVHQRMKTPIEHFRGERVFDLATFRMVVEHITRPALVIDSLKHLIRPGGKVVVYTVNRCSPSTILSSLVPFRLHHAIKRIFFRSEDKDTFPVAYRMNTRGRLAELFKRGGFKESFFTYLDDCRILNQFRILTILNLSLWRSLNGVGLRYPEQCLLGIYERV